MGKLPAFQFYPGDWRKDVGVQSLSFHDRGVWWEMLCLMHESERRGVLVLNGHPISDDCLGRLLGLDKQILNTTLTTLLTSGVASRDEETGAIYSRRMVRDENLRKVRTMAGSKGGNPVLLNQNSTTKDKQIPTPSFALSSSEENNTTSSAGRKLRAVPKEEESFTLPDWVPANPWNEWIKVRKKIKAPNTPYALSLAIRDLDKLRSAGENPETVLNLAISRGWRGLFAPPTNGSGSRPAPKTIYANEVTR